VLLPLIVGLVYLSYWAVVALTAVAIIVALNELYTALRHHSYAPRRILGITTGIFLCMGATLQGQGFVAAGGGLGFVLAYAIIGGLVAELRSRTHEGSFINWSITLATACYVGWLLSHYILLRGLDTPLNHSLSAWLAMPPGAAWVYMVLAVTWMSDTGAMFVGRSFGRHPMTPYLSPKKSWEGAIGGLVVATLTALLAVWLLGLPLTSGETLVLGVCGGIAAQVGDLAESLIKRQIGVKDLSHLIPGHGGILDRIDSMLFTAPVMYYLILIMQTF
jgi:phosphatidate cytidylyltransferase